MSKWAARGRQGDPEASEFAERFDALREGRGDEPLTDDELVGLLERSARRGSVRAIQMLLERKWEAGGTHSREERPASPFEGMF